MAVRITDGDVRKALQPIKGHSFIWDEDVKGFGLRITKGAKSFILDYRSKGRQRRLTIGTHPDWTVAAAREQAKILKREVDLGYDPMGERHAEREAPTMNSLWERYKNEHLIHKSPRSQADEKSMFEKIVLPRLGKLKLSEIGHADIDKLHYDITNDRKTPTRANRVTEVLRKAFNLAIRWKIYNENPALGVRRNYEEKRDRYLNKSQLIALVNYLDRCKETSSANAIKFLMLTGARRGEALRATWDMFDLENGIWTKPSSHTKQRRVHRVPLNEAALILLQEIKHARTVEYAQREKYGEKTLSTPYVFPHYTGQPITDVKRTWIAACRSAGLMEKKPKKGANRLPIVKKDGSVAMEYKPAFRLHDLRHSFASILVSGGASLPIVGQMLGHTQVSTTQRYAHLYDETMREAANKVGNFITSY